MASRTGNNRKKTRVNKTHVAQVIAVIVLFIALIVALALIVSGGRGNDAPAPNESGAPVESQTPTGSFASGTTVNGVDISGMDYTAARAALEGSLSAQLEGIRITLTDGTTEWPLDESSVQLTTTVDEVLTQALTAGAGAYSTNVTAAESEISAFVENIAAQVDSAPVEPTLSYQEGSVDPFVVTPGQNGRSVDVAATVAAIMEQFETGRYGRVDLAVTEVAPTISEAELKSSVSLIASFSTTFSTSDSNRVTNLQLATAAISGTQIAPGETFSFNGTTGERTAEKGYKEAHVLVNGTRYEDGIGGGVCQVSTTLYNALLLTGADFADFSRVNHSIPSSYVPRGQDATVDYPSKDLKFTNSSDSTMYIIGYLSNTDTKEGTITFEIYGKALPAGVTYQVTSVIDETLTPPAAEYIEDPTEPSTYKVTLQTARNGYVVSVYRERLQDGSSTGEREKLYTDRYSAVQGIYTIGTASTGGSDSGSGDSGFIPNEGTDDGFIPEEGGSEEEEIFIPEER